MKIKPAAASAAGLLGCAVFLASQPAQAGEVEIIVEEVPPAANDIPGPGRGDNELYGGASLSVSF